VCGDSAACSVTSENKHQRGVAGDSEDKASIMAAAGDKRQAAVSTAVIGGA